MFYVYKMIHTTTGRLYIGQRKLPKGKTPETDGYTGSGKIWKCIYKAHPDECVKIVLEVVESKEEVDELEKKYIAHYRSVYGGLCVNIADGGEGGCGKLSEESRRKMSEAARGKHHTEETRRKISNSKKGKTSHRKGKRLVEEYGEERAKEIRNKSSLSHKGNHHSEESRRKMSEARKGRQFSKETRRKISEAQRGEKHHFFGKHHSEETRRKMSEAAKGRQFSEETRRKISEALKNRKDNA